QRMPMAQPRQATRQRHVHGGRSGTAETILGQKLCPSRLDRLLQIVREPANDLLLLGRGSGHELHPRGHYTVLASQEAVPNALGVAGRCDLSQFRLEGGDLGVHLREIGNSHGWDSCHRTTTASWLAVAVSVSGTRADD